MEIYELGKLFEAVQMQNILADGKTFPDCLPKMPLTDIKATYESVKNAPDFDLKAFVEAHFDLPTNHSDDFKSDLNQSITTHITKLWAVLTRQPDAASSSLIPLPHSYIVPGGRFREIYYWDSYFTMLGLQASKRVDLIENMVKNFSFLLNTIGHIPNGNRTYYVGRSQPPFYALMVRLLSAEKGQKILKKYLPELEKEYSFWMNGSDLLSAHYEPFYRIVRMPDGSVLNRYWDEHDTPRPESFKEDVETAQETSESSDITYRHLRAAAESGWDFSSRWFKDGKTLATIHTTDIVPVDLNCLLWHLEDTLAEAAALAGESDKAKTYQTAAKVRRKAIDTYFWNADKGFYFDYDFMDNKQTEQETLAAVFPLFFKLASSEQAEKVAQHLENKFLQTGGLTTSINNTGQQWDAPNGWAPLQWVAFKGLHNYGFTDLADTIKARWLTANQLIYQKTGKMTEKYNVYVQDLEAGGGEYPLQDGFGWTNGVYLAMENT